MADNMADKKRRQWGTGTVHQRTSDGRWIGSVEAGFTARGTRRRISVTYSAKPGESATHAEAEVRRMLRNKQLEIAKNGLPAARASGATTVAVYAEKWLERRADEVRGKTWSTDASMVRRWIIPTIGRRKVAALDTDAVHAVIAGAKLADSSLVRLRATLDGLLKAAILDGYPIPERVLMVPRTGRGRSDRDALAVEDAVALLAAAADRPDGSRYVAALLQGMRQAECLGFTWDAYDRKRGLVDVSWQLQAVPYRHGCGEPVGRRYPCGRRFGGDCPSRRLHRKRGDEIRQLDGALCLVRPKTEAGERFIPVVAWFEAALEEWAKVAPASPHGLVWPRADGRPALAVDDDAAWYDLQDAAQVARTWPSDLTRRGDPSTFGRRYTIHEARHTTATLLREAEVPDYVIIAIMGHASILSTRPYLSPAKHAELQHALAAVAERLQLGKA